MLDLLAQSPVAFIAAAAAVGLVVGSFLNVVVYRLPIMLERQWQAQCAAPSPAPAEPAAFNLVVPRSCCPACRAPISAMQNIPLLSYLALRGRCAHCQAKISLRYPAVELLSGVSTALVAWKFGFGWSAACGMVVGWFLIALTFIDLDHQLLPDALTLPLLWLGLLASLAGWNSGAQALPRDPVSAIGGAAIG